MTTTEQINDLIAGFTDLKTFFEGERQRLEDARSNLTNDLYIKIYVDEINGAEGGDGSLASPFNSLDTALLSLKQGQSAEFRLLSNATLNRRHDDDNTTYRFSGRVADDSGAALRAITVAPVAENSVNDTGGLTGSIMKFCTFVSIELKMPDNDPALFSSVLNCSGFLGVAFRNCEIDGVSGDVPLIGSVSGGFSLGLKSTTYAAMNGRWVEGFASGVALTADAAGGLIDPSITN
ncbi:hypothetical protein [Leisingera sp. ANG-Vp]|uniref:hypothetical protein n=1 Tax=Leisingera sp. ANG-Vp TaxID=1577896 RepID=UPI00058057A7|nr:hypothetical protein [Leisingera sp. ANG-Vp]KIC14064.1 hypothetical protein RA20_21585 [Leisingera sp. ANG-Vp]